MITTVIFDLDGLLADTESLHRKSYQEALGLFDVTITPEQYAEHWITKGRGIEDLVRERGLTIDIEKVRKKKAESYRHLVTTSVQPMPGAEELLIKLKGEKILALASSSYHQSVDWVIQTLQIKHFFNFIAANQDVARLKPFPDLFLFTAEKLGVEAHSCIVIEDAEKGVLAAKAAGMKCIAVPNEHTRNNDFSTATRVVSSLHDITREMLN